MQHLYDLIRPYWPTLLLFVGYPLVTAALNWWLWWDTPESWDAFAAAHPRLATLVRLLRALSPHLRKVAVVWRDLARARSAPGLLPTLDDLAHHRTTQPGPAPKPPGQQPGRVTVGALLALLVVTAACPAWRQLTAPAVPGEANVCAPRATRCDARGVPQVCSGSGHWTDADRPCVEAANVAAVCCLARSPVTGAVHHACVTADRCLDTDGGLR